MYQVPVILEQAALIQESNPREYPVWGTIGSQLLLKSDAGVISDISDASVSFNLVGNFVSSSASN